MLFRSISEFHKRQVFVCGPSGFMESVKRLMIESGLPEEQYHQETFGVARVADGSEKRVQINLDGVVFEGSNQRTVLEQAEAAGLSISNNCRAGFCGACKVTVKSRTHLLNLNCLCLYSRRSVTAGEKKC